MDSRITIQQTTPSRNAYGEETLVWSTLATVWAKVENKIGGSNEAQEALRETSTNKVHFTIRYRSDIKPKMRISYNSEYYDILFLHEISDRRRKGYTLIVTEKKETINA